ncbi:cytidyltransferase-like protein [Dysgonomonas sp. PFB1-18]|uniref:adenylyltransferase/cytidyltransferase family protein n=1 Tax=unclassified Dysgonomonas TaxID=2630389 RepID=UPI0024740E9D|nr:MULTISPECIES: adenylyltransferase/cytidyltransferase family protein [unclassified Dysgonomonas]MDH6309159.1 cytidyltransferase-like protein [Dysgonomonas sp. PF1-14]MDH6338961.1 cytidyltransferase-like protein [Dysgonomonas sp. PF1-16]MDH6380408.1 cytidyltransferase-like protein [Dysgonomonas sp. PFB1-18]MDH6397789.1 cytidyltransferase-like protein [Dysgonomonas sp. PF1-23]
MKKVFVSGCYDMLHSGHVAFFEEAATYGDLYVGIGSDKTVNELKARKTFNNEQERLYMIKALKSVKDAWVNTGSGLIDFLEELKTLKPDIFFVNSDGHSALKEELCRELGIQYVVSKRIPHENLPSRSTTALREECRIPYRIDLAGGWLDQPSVSTLYAGPVLTISVEPDYEFNDRSGMSTSSRKKAIELWQIDIPAGNKEKLAKTLFCYENPPGTKYVSGSQDSLGIVMPGLNRLHYNGDFWPTEIENVLDDDLLNWIEKHLWLVPLYPRHCDYDVLSDTNITPDNAKKLSDAAIACWEALKQKDLKLFGTAVRNSFEAQITMYPHMVNKDVFDIIDKYKDKAMGWKLSGAGGGGYFIIVNDKPIDNAIQIRIRRGE